jgi:transglutaminase-like putative cysteine protease
MHLNIEHRTRYTYDVPVDYTIQQLRLTPQSGFGQRVKCWEIRVNGKMQPHADTYGNASHTLVVDTPHHEIEITARGEVETGLDIPPQHDILPLSVYLRATPLTAVDERLACFARTFALTDGGLDQAGLEALMQAVREQVVYQRGSTGVHTNAAEAFAAGEGVCQDHAHIFTACCRHLGVPARYVSGYLFTQDGYLAESHAWADAWMHGEWLSFDVSNGQRTNGIHVRLATGLDYRDACPVTGVRRGGGGELMSVCVQVQQSQQ